MDKLKNENLRKKLYRKVCDEVMKLLEMDWLYKKYERVGGKKKNL